MPLANDCKENFVVYYKHFTKNNISAMNWYCSFINKAHYGGNNPRELLLKLMFPKHLQKPTLAFPFTSCLQLYWGIVYLSFANGHSLAKILMSNKRKSERNNLPATSDEFPLGESTFPTSGESLGFCGSLGNFPSIY